LKELGGDLELIADRLKRHAEAHALDALTAGRATAITAPMVRRIIAAGRLREDHFGIGFGDPAWAMMLELFLARLEQRPLRATSLSRVSGVPLTTALRWIDRLDEMGILVRTPDPGDRSGIALSEKAEDQMRAYLLSALKLSPWVN
jgi:hypothetical protein